MDYNYTDEILNRLNAGETPDEIAASLSKSLNEARTAYEEQAKKDEVEKSKRQAVNDLIDVCVNILRLWDVDEDVVKAFDDLTDEDVDELVGTLDLMVPTMKASKDLKASFSSKKPNTAADPIEAFLNDFVRN